MQYTKGVCFFHLPKSEINLIQIIGRALRNHPEKSYAQIILPFSKEEDETAITNFMNILGRSDKRIKSSLESKTLGGYIHISKEFTDDDHEFDENIELKFNMVFDRLGVCLNRHDVWNKQLKLVIRYIDTNKKRPSHGSKDKATKRMAKLISTQLHN